MKNFIIKPEEEKEDMNKIKEFMEEKRIINNKTFEQEINVNNNSNNLIDSFNMNDIDFYQMSSDHDFFSH